MNNKNNKKIYFILFIQQLLIIFLSFIKIYFYNANNSKNIFYLKDNKLPFNMIDKFDYENNQFALIRRPCKICGFFSYYKVFISCLTKFIMRGYIPILEVESYPNVFNGFKANSSNKNSWEIFFNQPFGFTYEDVIKNAKNKFYYDCKRDSTSPQYTNIYSKKISIDFLHNIANKYIPLKSEIIKESNIIKNNMFNNSNNILGVLIRGTDYISTKPKGHPIPPNPDIVIKDIKKMDEDNKYNYIFLVTEDNKIRKKFNNIFINKLKYYLPKENINYDYKKKQLLTYNKNIKGNLENMKIYLINIIILSKCLDILTARTNGSIAAFIFTEGFRNIKVYYLGLYPKNK